MSQIPQNFIQDLIARVDLVDVINQRHALRKRGANYLANCPFHQEKTPSFTVSASKQFYHCFGCGANGNAITFLMEFDRLDFVSAVEQLAHQLGLEVPRTGTKTVHHHQEPLYAVLKKMLEFYQTNLAQHPQAQNYLLQRGVDRSQWQNFQLGFAPPQNQLFQQFCQQHNLDKNHLIQSGILTSEGKNRFFNRIIFPIHDPRGKIVGFGGRTLGDSQAKYLNSPETALFHKSRILYGLYECLQSMREIPYIVIVEGYLDVIALAQHGIHNVVATMGTATTLDHLKLLFRYTQHIIFCFDGDNAGQKAAEKAQETVMELLEDGRKISFMFLPVGEDPDSLIRKEPAQKFLQRIDQALPLSDFFFQKLQQQGDQNTLEGKNHLLSKARPYLEKIPSPLFQNMFLERLAKFLRLDLHQLQTFFTQKNASPLLNSSAKKLTITPLRMAFALLLQNPHLQEEITDITALKNLTSPGIPLFLEVVEQIRAHKPITTGQILELWRSHEHYKALCQLAALNPLIPPTGIVAEFKGALERLQKSDNELQVEKLLKKLNELNTEEKAQLQRLIAAKHDNLDNSG